MSIHWYIGTWKVKKKISFDFTGCNKERLPLEGFPFHYTPLEIQVGNGNLFTFIAVAIEEQWLHMGAPACIVDHPSPHEQQKVVRKFKSKRQLKC